MSNRTYICIDLKSFFASVECAERGLNPLSTNLVVADPSRTEKTICLAVTPSLKKYGIPGRARLFEVIQKVKEINFLRKQRTKYGKFIGKSYLDNELQNNVYLELDYIIAPPRMSYYMKYSLDIYNIYLNYLAPEDMYVYSIDEVFCDVTDYLKTYKMNAYELATKMINEVYEKTGITATAGIGTNLFLCKIAMDIVAKQIKPNEIGLKIAELDESSYRRKLWNHIPITDFWRVGPGYGKKLEKNGIYTMGDVAKCSINNEELLYRLFGVNAELLIDHAWGWEPCTMKDIKEYKPSTNSLSSGQVLHCPYDYKKAELIVKEMTELLTLDLVDKKLLTNQLTLTIGYDIENVKNLEINEKYNGEIVKDRYGRNVPKQAHGSINLEFKTSSTNIIVRAIKELYERIINKNLLIRRINVTANNLIKETIIEEKQNFEQLDLFTNYEEIKRKREEEKNKLEGEKRVQQVLVNIKKKYGKNAIIKGMNLEKGGTTIERNKQIGGHKG